ncbi:molybdopterin molybdotransferase MoeA [Francisellaceae bacterium]|nr:molybdopterin molybdotransferase MoeA [Francisellaceae bacterium]
MINYAEALSQILEHQLDLNIIDFELKKALGLIVAEDVYAPISIPSFDNSSMDGFAVIAENTKGASKEKPIWLKQVNSIAAGDKTSFLNDMQNTTVEIMTGAPIPKGYNAIIPVERTLQSQGNDLKIGIIQEVHASEFFRYKGTDIQERSLVLAKGTQINTEKLITLVSLGITNIKVQAPLNVHIISTGKELANLNSKTKENQVYDCNTPYLAARLQHQFSANIATSQLVTDSEEGFIDLLKSKILSSANPPQLIISTGAVSMGKYDFIPNGLRKVGAEIIFHKVSIRPGKPILFAKLPNGSYYFGLPGNPSSAAVGLKFFIEPFINHAYKMKLSNGIVAKIDEDYTNTSGLKLFLKAHHYINQAGESKVQIQPGQESFRVAPFINSNAWAVIEANGHLKSGNIIETYLF